MSKRKKEIRPAAGKLPAAGTGYVQPRTASEFNPDYSHVRKDLRRIAVIGGGILAVLLVLAIVLS